MDSEGEELKFFVSLFLEERNFHSIEFKEISLLVRSLFLSVVWSVICTLGSGWVEAGMSNGRVRSKVQEGFMLGLGEARGSYRPEWRKAILT